MNIWFYTEDEAAPNDAARTLSRAIGRAGIEIPCGGGHIWLGRGSPFSQPVDTDDNRLKCRYINILAEYLVLD
ncbi:MAG: hypothetical protein J6X53_06965 [Abditibacteriota bacterium]|nr:hypothetical protein [Abditibacteriota bacterium]